MKVSELIVSLQTMPQDREVLNIWDGAARSGIDRVYESKGGCVMTSDLDEVVYNNCDRPLGAPTPEQDKYWEVK